MTTSAADVAVLAAKLMYAKQNKQNRFHCIFGYFYVNNAAVLSDGQSNKWMELLCGVRGTKWIDKINAVTLAFVFSHFEKI